MNKHQRYRHKKISLGLCPRCGKKSSPYYLCPNHRKLLKIRRNLNRGVKFGLLKMEKKNHKNFYFIGDSNIHVPSNKSGSKNDKRILPRLNNKPISCEDLIKKVLLEPMTKEQIEIEIAQLKIRSRTPNDPTHTNTGNAYESRNSLFRSNLL